MSFWLGIIDRGAFIFMNSINALDDFFLSHFFKKGPDTGYRQQIEVTQQQYECSHIWEINEEVNLEFDKCRCCKHSSQHRSRRHCPRCKLTVCDLCSDYYLNLPTPVAPTQPLKFDHRNLIIEQQTYIAFCESEMNRLKEQVKSRDIERDEYQKLTARVLELDQINQNQSLELEVLRTQNQLLLHEQLENDKLSLHKEDLEKEIRQLQSQRDVLLIDDRVNVLLEEQTEKIIAEAEQVSGARMANVTNMLYNLKVTLEIYNIPSFEVNAILDTGATTCCIDQDSIPAQALEENTFLVQFSGIGSKSTSKKKLKGGKMTIGNNTFRIPYTYSFSIKLGSNIQMILGCNFIRSILNQEGVVFF